MKIIFVKNIFLGLFILTFLLLAPLVSVASPIIINEVAWMGTEASYNDEWIELYNNSQKEINVSGWKIKSKDGGLDIFLSGIVPPSNFYILERTDDQALPLCKATQIYNGVLNNNGEHLLLIDDKNNLMDEVECGEGWFAGNNISKQTMERKNPQGLGNKQEDWQTSQNPGGTPNAINSGGITKETIEIESHSQPHEYLRGIIFNEILPSPTGRDKEEEWIELYNLNSFKMSLGGWVISDEIGSTKNYTIPQDTYIDSKSFLVFPRPTTNITLNNQEDAVVLLSPTAEKIDRVFYQQAPQGKSYILTNNGWEWSDAPTPGEENSSLKNSPAEAKKEKGGNKLLEFKEGEASIMKHTPLKKEGRLLNIIFPAFFTAFLSGVIIYILGIKVKKIDF